MGRDRLFLEAEKKLKNFNFTKVRIKAIDIELESLESEVAGYKASTYQDVKIKSNEIFGIDDYLIKKEKKKENLLLEKMEKECEIKIIENTLKLLTETELKIIQFRYLNTTILSWDQISIRTGYSVSHCKRLRIKAIDKIKASITWNIKPHDL